MRKMLPINSIPSVISCIHHAYPEAIIEAREIVSITVNDSMSEWRQHSVNSHFQIEGGTVKMLVNNGGFCEGALYRECATSEELVVHVDFDRPRDFSRYIDVFVFDDEITEEMSLEDKKYGVRWNPYGYFLVKEMYGIDTKKNRYIKVLLNEGNIIYFSSDDGIIWNKLGEHTISVSDKLKIGIHLNMGDDGYLAWKNSNFIQLSFNKDNEYKGIFLDYFSFPRKNVDNSFLFYINYLDVSYELTYEALELFEGFTQYIKWSIDHNYYLAICLDEFFVPERAMHKKKHYEHYNLFYGYDDTDMVFYLMGYGELGKPVVSELPFSAFEKKLVKSEKITKYKYATNDNAHYSFDISFVISELEALLNNNQSNYKFEHMIAAEPLQYGIDIIKNLATSKKEKKLVRQDMRIVYCLKEHSELMLKRIEYLNDNGFLSLENHNLLRNQCVEIINENNILLMLILKNKIKKVSDEKIDNQLMKIYDKEVVFLEEFIVMLKKDNGIV